MAGGQTANASTVTAQSGDTVWGFSQAYHVSVKSIVKANSLADANLIYINQKLTIPDGQTTAKRSSGTSTAATTPTTGQSTTKQATTGATTQKAATTTSKSASSTQPATTAGKAASSTVTSSSASQAASSSSQMTGNTTASSQATSTSQSQTTGQTYDHSTGATSTQTGNTTANTTSTPAASASSAQSSTTTTSSSSTANVANGGGVAAALKIANSNVPYVYGGSSMSGFDCSGLVQYAFGLSARTTYQQTKLGTHHYDVANAPAGAILFWGSDSAPYHDGISLGNGQYVAAQNEADGIGVFSQSVWQPSYYIVL